MGKAFSSVPFNGSKEQELALEIAIKELKDLPGSLMPILQKAQEIYGYLPESAIKKISTLTGHSMSEIFGVATFYSQFSLNPKGRYQISICLGTACYVKGSNDVYSEFEKRLKLKNGECTPDGKYSLAATRCIGCCGLAPVGTVNDEVFGKMTVKDVDKILAKYDAME